MYSNTWQIKSFLEKTIFEKQDCIEPEHVRHDPNVIRFEKTEEFKGVQWTSFRGVALWGFILFFLVLIILKAKPGSTGLYIFFGIFATFWYLLHSWLMHYFALTKDCFIVRNHNLVWRQHIYRLKDIKEIVFETQGQRPNCLRVITKDHRNKLYPAGTLRDKKWLELQERLNEMGIRVRNECIF